MLNILYPELISHILGYLDDVSCTIIYFVNQKLRKSVINKKYISIYAKMVSKNKFCSNAALNGYLEILKWAQENGCPSNVYTCRNAALNGHLETLKWARLNGCRWDESTCRSAALNGYLETLKWARENGCPWNESTCRC